MSKAATMAATAGSFFEKKDYKNALICFDQSISLLGDEKLTPQRVAWIYAHRAETYQLVAGARGTVLSDEDVNRMLDQAERDYHSALAADETYAWGHAHLGELCRQQVSRFDIRGSERKRLDALGRKSFARAVELDPNYAWAYAHWGAFLINMRTDYEEALDHLRKAQKLRHYNDAWVFANEMVAHYQQDNMKRAFNALVCSISIDTSVFTSTVFPAEQIFNGRKMDVSEQFLWALRNFLAAKHRAKGSEEQRGPLKGFYEPFVHYFTIVQHVVSWLADGDIRDAMDSAPEPLPPLPPNNTSRSAEREENYRRAGLLALAYKASLLDKHAPPGTSDKLKKEAMSHLGPALIGLDPQYPRDKELLDLAIRDVALFELADDIKQHIPENFQKFLGYQLDMPNDD